MYSRILIPLDGSRLSEGILPWARSIVRAVKTPVELLVAIEPETISAFSNPEIGRYFDTVGASMTRDSLAYLEKLGRSFSDSADVHCFAEIGNPAEIIVDRASADRGALIAMATHGRSGVQRWVLGSVADKVLHAATNHLLLVRPGGGGNGDGEATLKRVLVPLDGSALAETVLPHVRALAETMELEVMLLRVYSMDPYAYAIGAEGYAPDLEILRADIKGEEAKRYLEEKADQLRWQGMKNVSHLLLEGNAAGEIIDVAKGTPDNLVAMCTNGRSGVGRWVLGSVTDRVVRHSGDPVLVIRAKG